MFGIENLKKAALLAIQFGQQIEQSSKEGFKITDLFSFVDEIAQLPGVIASKDQIVQEFKDLTSEERAELVAYIETTLTLENKKVEELIEAGLEFLLSLLILVEKIKGPKSEEPPVEQ